VTHPTTVLLADALGPGLNRDADGNPNTVLEGWLDGPGHLLGAIDDLVRGDGWTDVLDPTATPTEWLGWVGQFAGVRLRRGLTEAQQRNRVLETAGQRRGTPEAIRGAARQLLTGSRLVKLQERTDADGNPSAYDLRVTTFEAETPDPGAVEAAIAAEKPAGLILHYRLLPGATNDQVAAGFATYDDLTAEFTDYDNLGAYVPGGA